MKKIAMILLSLALLGCDNTPCEENPYKDVCTELAFSHFLPIYNAASKTTMLIAQYRCVKTEKRIRKKCRSFLNQSQEVGK